MCCYMSTEHGAKWCHIQTDQVHLVNTWTSLMMLPQMNWLSVNLNKRQCQLCWLWVNGWEAEVLCRLYWCYKCIVSKQSQDTLWSIVGKRGNRVIKCQYWTVQSHGERTPLWKQSDRTRVNPGRAGHRPCCLCVCVCVCVCVCMYVKLLSHTASLMSLCPLFPYLSFHSSSLSSRVSSTCYVLFPAEALSSSNILSFRFCFLLKIDGDSWLFVYVV